jgi:phage head maturation protease
MIMGKIRGYANVFNVLSAPIGDPPVRAIVRPGAFMLLGTINAACMRGSKQIATTWDKSLRLWQDSYGLAFEWDIQRTPDGAGLRNMVEKGIHSMSIGLLIKASTAFRDGDGVPCDDVSRADIDHISVVDTGAFPGACCQIAGTPPERMMPEQAAANRHWYFGEIDRERAQRKPQARRRVIDLILAGIIISGLPGTLDWALGLLVGIDMVFGGASLIAIALEARNEATFT